jgi:hypothetical protein
MRRSVGLALVLMFTSVLAPGVASADPTPGYVTVLFGRTQWVTVRSSSGTCEQVPNTVTLGEAKGDLDARGIHATGIVIPNRTPESGLRCFGSVTQPGWDTLLSWQADGWTYVSGGTHANMTTLTYEQQVEESCGSLEDFTARGIDASGMFAYGNNRYTTEIQTDPVSTCFEFGRRYAAGTNQRATTGPPWFAGVHSVNGGKCNDPGLPCYTTQYVSPYRYHSPDQMAANVAAAPDSWYAVQFYRFVDGAYSSSDFTWDCTSADWRQHFTSHTELYCYRDFLRVMDALQAAVANGVVVADPETVANAWGRSVDPPPPPAPDVTPPSVSITNPADGSSVAKRSTVTITSSASDDTGVTRLDTSVNDSTLCSVTSSTSSCAWKVPAKPSATYTITVTARDAAGNIGTATSSVRSV